MSLAKPPAEVEYPETDGNPMGETDWHRQWMQRILDLLRYRYRDQHVYLASDLLVYYEEGNPLRFVVPDNFVVLDCAPGNRRTFKIWEEDRVPDVVFEVTSRGTARQDAVVKPRIYEEIGVRELFLYDPEGESLNPPLQGYRRVGGMLKPIEPRDETISCEALQLNLALHNGELTMFDRATGEQLLTEAEAEHRARRVAESEVQRLREEIERLKRGEA